MSDVVERLEATKFGLYWDVARDALSEITRLRQLLSEADKRENEARVKALGDAAMRVDKLIADMQALDKFNRPYALRMTALAAKAIRALQSEER